MVYHGSTGDVVGATTGHTQTGLIVNMADWVWSRVTDWVSPPNRDVCYGHRVVFITGEDAIASGRSFPASAIP